MSCRCCRKDGKFCSCGNVRCADCHRCITKHCDCSVPRIKESPTSDRERRSQCKGCGERIWWQVSSRGYKSVNSDGSMHWPLCPGNGKKGARRR